MALFDGQAAWQLLQQVEWAHPAAAWVWPVPALVWWLRPHRSRRVALRVPFFRLAVEGTGQRPQRGAVIRPHGVLGWLLLLAAWTACVAAVMQPQWVEPPLVRVKPMRDWLLAVDLSPSMRAKDFRDASGKPIDRLTVVRDVLDELLARRADDRVGLLVFAQQAHVQVPFTRDHAAVRALLAESSIGMAGSQTMIGDALGLAVKVFDESQAPQRTLVLLTDGRDTGSMVPPLKAAEIAAQRGIRVHTIAIGTAAASKGDLPDFDGLKAWSSTTGGRAFRASDRAGLQAIYRELDALETREHETLSVRPRRPLYHLPLMAGMVLMGLHAGATMLSGAWADWRGRRRARALRRQEVSHG